MRGHTPEHTLGSSRLEVISTVINQSAYAIMASCLTDPDAYATVFGTVVTKLIGEGLVGSNTYVMLS
jgi:hypothetical protein